jgi:hypothetical protein
MAIDLRSDTVTQPSDEMRAAIASAPVGDDVYGDDPTVNSLEERVAALFGKEAGLFCPTGSLANQLAIRTLVKPGEELLVETRSHIVRAELGAAATFTGNVSIAGTLTYEDVTNVDSVGLVTARAGAHVATSSGNLLVGTASSTGTASQPLQVNGGAYVSGSVGIGTTRPTSTLQVVGGDTRLGGVIETVGTAVTYNSGNVMVVEMDVRQATTYSYTMPTGANIGIVSFRNMPAQTGSPSGSTITLLVTQNAAGTGNTTAATGIGTNCTVVGYENGASVAGISTRGLVGSGTSVTLSSTGRDRDFIAFFIQYTGGTNTTASSYQVYLMKNGSFR